MIGFEKKQLVIFSGIAVVAVLFAMLGYYPLTRALNKSRGQEKQFKSMRDQTYCDAMGMSNLAKKNEELKNEVGNYNSKIPLEREFATFWNEMTRIMNTRELSERLVEPLSEVEGKTLNCIPLNIECRGRLSQLHGFLRDIEAMERIVRFEAIRFENDKDYSGDLKLIATAKIFYRNEIPTIASDK